MRSILIGNRLDASFWGKNWYSWGSYEVSLASLTRGKLRTIHWKHQTFSLSAWSSKMAQWRLSQFSILETSFQLSLVPLVVGYGESYLLAQDLLRALLPCMILRSSWFVELFKREAVFAFFFCWMMISSFKWVRSKILLWQEMMKNFSNFVLFANSCKRRNYSMKWASGLVSSIMSASAIGLFSLSISKASDM